MPSSPIEASVVAASVGFIDRRLDVPLRLSSGTITDLTEARATVRVRVGDAEADGKGAVYLSDVWAWPDPNLAHAVRDARMRQLCEEIAANLDRIVGAWRAHPLELGLRLHEELAGDRSHPRAVDDPPLLARILCGSPFDAAIHDATGRALQRSAFDLYGTPQPIPSADRLFPASGTVAAIANALRPPVRRLEAWWVVGRDDDLEAEAEAIHRGGFRSFKLKLLGGPDPREDAAWTASVYRALRRLGVDSPILSGDANGGYATADDVESYLAELEAADAEAYAALSYLEQPTAWDLRTAAFDWRPVTRRKPVVADEGLTGLDILPELERQGWSGVALKTCKGHSLCLVAAAWARQRAMILTMQDLTNPGLAAIHAALFAAHLHTANGVELNSPQYTPGANSDWLPRLSGLFEPRGGVHRLPDAEPPGLGSNL